jgi:hypothetical protein
MNISESLYTFSFADFWLGKCIFNFIHKASIYLLHLQVEYTVATVDVNSSGKYLKVAFILCT